MLIWAMAAAAFPDVSLGAPAPALSFDLAAIADTPAPGRRLPARKRRSRYLLPPAELPDADKPSLQIRWKLNKIKLKTALPSI